MPTPRKPSTILLEISNQRKLTGHRLIQEFKALPKASAIRLPPGHDDREDIAPVLLALTAAERRKIRLPAPDRRGGGPHRHRPLAGLPGCAASVSTPSCAPTTTGMGARPALWRWMLRISSNS